MENKQIYNIFLIHMIRFLIFEISCNIINAELTNPNGTPHSRAGIRVLFQIKPYIADEIILLNP
jgi:hypothetical protein